MSSLSLPPEEELALLRAEVASLRQELEQVRKVERAGGRDERGGNGNKASTRSCIVNNGGGGGNAIDDESLPPPPQRAGDRAFWEADHPLSTPQIERYCRQMLLPWFGPAAQARLASSSALVVGLGGLGCPAALYLAAAGVGKLGLCDRDCVDVSNLHRQVLHENAAAAARSSSSSSARSSSSSSASSGPAPTPKVESAAAALRRLNPETELELFGEGLTPRNAEAIVEGFDVVLDCSDNAPTRYLLSDACCRRSRGRGRNRRSRGGNRRTLAAIPLVSGAAIGGDGQLTVYCAGAVREKAKANEEDEEGDGDGSDDDECDDDDDDDDDDTPCYRCLFPVPPPAASCGSCAEAGVLGPVPGVVGVLQALEAIKLLALGSKEERRKKEREKERGGPAAAAAASSSSPSSLSTPPLPLPPPMTPLCRRMLAFDGREARFRTVQLRPRSRKCAACGGDGEEELDIASFDYEAFTGRPSHDGPPTPARILPQSRRVPAVEAAAWLLESDGGGNGGNGGEKDTKERGKGLSPPPLFLDVRPASQFGLARLPGSVNVPWGSGGDAFLKRAAAAAAAVLSSEGEEEKREEERAAAAPVVVVCRRGNDSQRAVAAIDEALAAKGKEGGPDDIETLRHFLEGRPAPLVDVVGGLEGMAAVGSFEFPRY